MNRCLYGVAFLLFLSACTLPKDGRLGDSNKKEDFVTQPNQARTIYLLGVDLARSGQYGKRLQQVITPGDSDSWSLTRYVRRSADKFGTASINISDQIQQWNPEVDPYNFAAISLRDIEVTQSTWKETGDTWVYIAVNLLWINVGHDIGTRNALMKTPELRSAISEYSIVRHKESAPPTKEKIDRMIKNTFDQALTNLFKKVARREERQVKRNAANTYYIVVDTPKIYSKPLNQIKDFYKNTAYREVFKKIPYTLGAFLEEEVMLLLEDDERYDRVLILPNTETLAVVAEEWPRFASRVASSNAYSGSLSSILGEAKLPVLKNLCVPKKVTSNSKNNEVLGLEIRSGLVDIHIGQEHLQPGISIANLKMWLAGDVKLPISQTESKQVLAEKRETLIASETFTKKFPTAIPAEEFYDPIVMTILLGNGAKNIAKPIVNRLSESMKHTPNLNHPILLRNCQ